MANRLGKKSGEPGRFGLFGLARNGGGREQDQTGRRQRGLAPDELRQGQPVHARHLVIEDRDMVGFPTGLLPSSERLECLFARSCLCAFPNW